jgi:5-methylcytosine-specific restriction endonuclease McrA
VSYDGYLRSAQWQRIRREALDWAWYRCQLCNDEGELHVHHRTYERFGREHPADLIVLCRACHEQFHQVEPPYVQTMESLAEASARKGGGWVATNVLDP